MFIKSRSDTKRIISKVDFYYLMDIDQKVLLYNTKALSLKQSHLEIIKQYYNRWEADNTINLKHRFIKLFVLNKTASKTMWIRLDKYFNKRRIQNRDVGNLIRKLIEENIYPVRIFQSVSEWLDPRAVIQGNKNTRLINSGLLVFENDDSLEESILCAKELDTVLKGNKTFVFSGNISIHVWYHDFVAENYIKVNEEEFIIKREYYDRVARYNAFVEFKEKINYDIDKRVIIDSRRVVPMINTINALTGRIVTKLESLDISTDILRKNTQVWN